MLFQRINILSGGVFGHETVIVNGINVLFLGNHVSKAPACAVLKTDAPCVLAQNAFDIIAVVQLVIKARGDFHMAGWITILNDDDVVGLEEWSPEEQFQEQKYKEVSFKTSAA